jgi:ubiquinone/menaquinone biosynthesis C-methylase UbiE
MYLSDVPREINRLQNQVDRMWPKERRNLVGLGLKDGMSVLEFASGPGFFTERLATLVPNGSITCVEPEPALVKHATEYLKGRVGCRYEILQTTGEAMELKDNSFDFVVARIVYQFLRDPALVTQKLARYLKPGGTLIITDYDAEIPPITEPPQPEARAILAKAMSVGAQMGANLLVGRRLWNFLKNAGLTELDLDAVVFHSGTEGVRSCLPQIDPTRLEPLVKAGALTEAEMKTLRSSVDSLVTSKDAFYFRVVLMASGRKPLA